MIDIDSLPNFMMIPEQRDKPDDIIQDYYEIIIYAINQNDYDSLYEVLESFFDDVNNWSVKELLINQAKVNLYSLQTLEEIDHEFIEDGMDDEYYFDD